MQWFDKTKLLLPALSAIARVEPAEGDGFCVPHSMLASQGQPDDLHACLDLAWDKCQEFMASKDWDAVSA